MRIEAHLSEQSLQNSIRQRSQAKRREQSRKDSIHSNLPRTRSYRSSSIQRQPSKETELKQEYTTPDRPSARRRQPSQ